MRAIHLCGMLIGIPAFAWLWNMTDWKMALAIILILFANNLSQIHEENKP